MDVQGHRLYKLKEYEGESDHGVATLSALFFVTMKRVMKAVCVVRSLSLSFSYTGQIYAL